MNSATSCIYVALANQAPEAWCPVLAAPRAGGLYQILSRNDDPESELWQFPSGSLVRCEPRRLDGRELLLAVELVVPAGPKAFRRPAPG